LNAFDFSRVIFKILDFPHWVDVDIARFQKNTRKKQKKSKFCKKKRKLRDQFWEPSNISPINISQNYQKKGRRKFTKWRGAVWRVKKKGKPKSIFSPSCRRPTQAWTRWVSSPPSISTSYWPQTPSHGLILPAHNLSASTIFLPKTNQTDPPGFWFFQPATGLTFPSPPASPSPLSPALRFFFFPHPFPSPQQPNTSISQTHTRQPSPLSAAPFLAPREPATADLPPSSHRTSGLQPLTRLLSPSQQKAVVLPSQHRTTSPSTNNLISPDQRTGRVVPRLLRPTVSLTGQQQSFFLQRRPQKRPHLRPRINGRTCNQQRTMNREREREKPEESRSKKRGKNRDFACVFVFFVGDVNLTASAEGKRRQSRAESTSCLGLSAEMHRHCSCGCRRPSLQFLEF